MIACKVIPLVRSTFNFQRPNLWTLHPGCTVFTPNISIPSPNPLLPIPPLPTTSNSPSLIGWLGYRGGRFHYAAMRSKRRKKVARPTSVNHSLVHRRRCGQRQKVPSLYKHMQFANDFCSVLEVLLSSQLSVWAILFAWPVSNVAVRDAWVFTSFHIHKNKGSLLARLGTVKKIRLGHTDSDTGSVSCIVFCFRYDTKSIDRYDTKNIDLRLRYDPKWKQDVLGHISAKYWLILLQYGSF